MFFPSIYLFLCISDFSSEIKSAFLNWPLAFFSSAFKTMPLLIKQYSPIDLNDENSLFIFFERDKSNMYDLSFATISSTDFSPISLIFNSGVIVAIIIFFVFLPFDIIGIQLDTVALLKIFCEDKSAIFTRLYSSMIVFLNILA